MDPGDSKDSTMKEEEIEYLKEIDAADAMESEQVGKDNDVTLSVQPMPLPEAQREALPGAYAQGGRPRFAPPVRGRPPAPVRTNSDVDTVQTFDTEGLVEARAVDEDEDPTSHSHKDLEMAKPVLKPSTEKATRGGKREFFFLLLCVAALVGGAVLLVTLMSTSSSSSQETDAKGELNSSSDSTSFSQKDYLISLLPDISLKAIEQDSKSSQSKAFDWVLSDPSFSGFTPERIHQRFALATLFYATGGSEWSNNDHWLSYETHECHWFHTPECFHWCECEDEKPFHPCDETNTTYLEISLVTNELKGTLPPELFLLPSLESVTIKGNDFLTGTLPTELMEQSQALWNLHLSGNSLTGTVPTEVLKMNNLTHLRLCCNEFEGIVPTELGLFGDQLLELVLDTNKLEGTIPTELALLAQMTDLRLAINDLTGLLPTEFGRLGELEYLRIHDLPVTGSLPTEYGLLSNLEYLRMSHLPITGSIPTEYGMLSNLEYFRLENSTVTGRIPTEVGLWEKLTKLYITDSPNLEGSMPSQLGLLAELKLMYLYNNSLTGTIPTEFGGMESLEHAYLHDNDITGTLPTELGKIGTNTLTQLKLFDNEVTGLIPSELGLFQVMETFELQGNILSGMIPEELAWLANSEKMATFNVSNNMLIGSIPEPICNVNFTSFDCGAVCGCDCPCSN